MKRFFIKPMYWRKPLATMHKHRKRVLLTRARNCDGASPGWHLWFYTYPNGVQRGRMLAIMGRWVFKAAPSQASGGSEHG
jgi:hypothetical protein